MRPPRRVRAAEPIGRLSARVAIVAWVATAGWIVAAGPGLGLGPAAVAPPLVVGMVERFATADRSAVTGVRHWAVIVAAAAVGAFAADDITPRWVGGLIAVMAVLVVFASSPGLTRPRWPSASSPRLPSPTIWACG